jgi:hypothetical protein
MSMTGVALSPEMRAKLAVGHDPLGAQTSNWDFDALAGAGALRSTAADMLKFLDANLGEPVSDLERAMRLAQTPRADAGSTIQRIGLNWGIQLSAGGVEVVAHNGGTGGYRTCLAFDRAREVGVVVLSNQSSGVDDLCFHLLDPESPLASSHAEIDLSPEQLERFTGLYALDNNPSVRIAITLEDGALVSEASVQDAAASSGKVPVFPESETAVFARAVDAQMSLVLDMAGEVTGLVLHQNGAEQTATRIGPRRRRASRSTCRPRTSRRSSAFMRWTPRQRGVSQSLTRMASCSLS